MGKLFGKQPKTPKPQPNPPLKVEPTGDEVRAMTQQLVKRRRATMLNQAMFEPNILRRQLGAATA